MQIEEEKPESSIEFEGSSSEESPDYEVYQGVVGRPGIDFPVLVGIPQTGFNCRNYGNGYFADLETDCQVSCIAIGIQKLSISLELFF